MKFWLADLARELDAAADDRALPALSLDRVWISRANTAVIVECLGAAPAIPIAGEAALRAPAVFLAEVAARALGGETTTAPTATNSALPINARSELGRLSDPSVTGARMAASIVEPLALLRDDVPRWRRALPIAAVTLPVVAACLFALIHLPLMQAQQRLGLDRLTTCLDLLSENARTRQTGALLTEYRQVEIYVSGQFGEALRGPAGRALSGSERNAADDALRDYPTVSPQLFAWARQRVEPAIDGYLADDRALTAMVDRVGLPAAVGAIATILLACFSAASVILSIARPGGVLLGWIDISVVDEHGQPISRARSVARAAATWSPLALAAGIPIAVSRAPSLVSTLVMWAPVMLLAAGAAVALRTPSRGIADRVCGTWLV